MLLLDCAADTPEMTLGWPRRCNRGLFVREELEGKEEEEERGVARGALLKLLGVSTEARRARRPFCTVVVALDLHAGRTSALLSVRRADGADLADMFLDDVFQTRERVREV